jgi:hypothetical protein
MIRTPAGHSLRSTRDPLADALRQAADAADDPDVRQWLEALAGGEAGTSANSEGVAAERMGAAR